MEKISSFSAFHPRGIRECHGPHNTYTRRHRPKDGKRGNRHPSSFAVQVLECHLPNAQVLRHHVIDHRWARLRAHDPDSRHQFGESAGQIALPKPGIEKCDHAIKFVASKF